MFLLGFLISYWSARRTLHRVERITETVARIGTEDLKERLPEPVNSDEISRLAKTFNNMLDRLQSSVNQLRTVTGSIAHDLKSPVTLIRGTLESALCNEGDEDVYKRQRLPSTKRFLSKWRHKAVRLTLRGQFRLR